MHSVRCSRDHDAILCHPSQNGEKVWEFGRAVGSNSGHHPAKDLNLLSRFHALGILHARFEKPSLHSALTGRLPYTTIASASACSLCGLPSPHQHLFCLAPLTPFALPSSDLQPSLRAASICDTSPAPEDLPHHHTTLSATQPARTR